MKKKIEYIMPFLIVLSLMLSVYLSAQQIKEINKNKKEKTS